MNTRTNTIIACAGLALAMAAATASAQSLSIQFDEYGNGLFNGTPLKFVASAVEPLSGQATLMYILPFTVTRGDLVLTEGTAVPATLTDIIRFDNDAASLNGLAYFFSDLPDPNETPVPLADTGIPPVTTLLSVTMPELGTEGNDGATYPAANGSPGTALVAGALQPVTYTIVSDGNLPEPATLSLLGIGALALIRRRSRT